MQQQIRGFVFGEMLFWMLLIRAAVAAAALLCVALQHLLSSAGSVASFC